MPPPRHSTTDRAPTRDELVFDHEHTWPQPPLPTREDTIPLVLTQCPDCLDGSHVWSEPGPEVLTGSPEFGNHTILHYRCICDVCFGRCDGRRISVRIDAATAGAAQPRHLADQPPPAPRPPDPRVLPHHKPLTEGPDALPTRPHPLSDYLDLVRASA